MELNPTLLRARGIRAGYGGLAVVDVGELCVGRGEVVAVLGPNGAGKSTLFRILLLLQPPDTGVVELDGSAVGPGDRAAQLRMAGVFQRPHLFAGTVESNVAFGLRARGLAAKEGTARVAEALRLFGLESLPGRDVRTLSGGEAQRVAVARALAVQPDVLLLDEPMANLDVGARRTFRRDLERAVRSTGRGVILITHDPADAFALADRIAVMEGGRIVQEATPETLVLEPATPFIAEFTGADLLLDGIVESAEGELAVVRLPGGARLEGLAAGPALPAGAAVHASYRPEDVTLALPGGRDSTSALNRFHATVTGLVPGGAMMRVRLQGDVSLIALITRRSAEMLRIERGAAVDAHLKATAVRVYRAD